MQTFFESIRPYFIYVPFLSTFSGLYKLCRKEDGNALPLKDRNISFIDPHNSAKLAISTVPFIGNFIVGVVDIAEKFFSPSNESNSVRKDEETIIEINKIKAELEKEYRGGLEKLKQENDARVEEINQKLSDEKERNNEIETELSGLKLKVASDKNPEIIVALASKNKDLVDELKAKESQLEEAQAQSKRLKEEMRKSGGHQTLGEREQALDKLRVELEAKNAVSRLCLAHIKRRQRWNSPEIYEIEIALRSLSEFRLENASVEEYELASRFNTALAKIELFKAYIEWRLNSHRNSFIPQLQAFHSAIESAVFLCETLNDKFPQKDFIEKQGSLIKLRSEICDILEDERIISLGKSAIQRRIKELDPDYKILDDSEIMDLWGETFYDDPYRIRVLKIALCNFVRNFDVSDISSFKLDDESSLQNLINEINDKSDLMQKLLRPNRKCCMQEIGYLIVLVSVAIEVFEKKINKTAEESEEYNELKRVLSGLKDAQEDEEIIESNEAIEDRIRSLDQDYRDYTSEQLLDLKRNMNIDEQPFRMKMLLTALIDPS